MNSIVSSANVESASADQELQKKLQCIFCGKFYKSRRSLSTHKSINHRNKPRQPRRTASGRLIQDANYKCGLCEIQFYSQFDLCHHLQMVAEIGGHGLQIRIQKQEFPDKESFQQWRQTVEAAGRFNFISRDGKCRLKSGFAEHLRCHRSGMYSSVAVRRAPSQKGSKKAGFHCSTFANVNFHQSGSVSAEFCVDHYGHDALVSRCRIPQEVVVEVRRLLRMDFTHKQVLDIVRREEETERRHSLTLANIVNIARAAGITAKRGYKTKNSNGGQAPKRRKRKSEEVDLSRVESPELFVIDEMGEKRQGIREACEWVEWAVERIQDTELLDQIHERMLELGHLVGSAALL